MKKLQNLLIWTKLAYHSSALLRGPLGFLRRISNTSAKPLAPRLASEAIYKLFSEAYKKFYSLCVFTR